MTDLWYYRSQSNEFGPYSAVQLRQFAQAGRITAKTLVRDGKQADWIPALQVRGLIRTTERPTAPRAPISPPAVPPRPGISAAILSDQVQKRPLPPCPVRRTKSGMLIATSVGSAVVIASVLLYVTIGRTTKAKGVPSAPNPVSEQVSKSKPALPPVVPPKAAPPQVEPSPALPLPRAESKPKPPTQALTTEEIVARCEAAVALIKGRVSSGTGFLVAPNLLVTNKHVLSSELIDHVKVYFPSPPFRRDTGNLISDMRIPECEALGIPRLCSASRKTAKPTFSDSSLNPVASALLTTAIGVACWPHCRHFVRAFAFASSSATAS
jgi:hypothetical protein